MPLSKKIAAFDIDGTLTKSKQPLEKQMALLLCELLKTHKVALIGGGSISQFKNQLIAYMPCVPEDIESTKNLILLPTSGSQCFQFDEKQYEWALVDEEKLPEDLRDKVLKAFEEIISSGQFDIPPKPYGKYVEDRGTQVTFSALGQKAPLELKEAWDPDQVKRQKIKKVLEEKLGNIVEIGIAGTTSIDILPQGLSKASALIGLLKRSNLEKKDMIFVGDAIFPGGNDNSVKEIGIETIKTKDPEQTISIIQKWLS